MISLFTDVKMDAAVDAAPAVRSKVTRIDAAAREAERRREERHGMLRSQASAQVLGTPEGAIPCRILDASRSGMRIALPNPVPAGTQVHVQWDDQFFIGAIRYRVLKGNLHILGLELVSCNYSRMRVPGAVGFGRLLLFCGAELVKALRSVARALLPPRR